MGGVAGDVPLVGDWNADGITEVGFLRQGFLWVLDYNGDYVITTEPGPDIVIALGGYPGDKPMVGDWNGNLGDEPGFFRQGFLWALDYTGERQFTNSPPDLQFAFGGIAGDKPLSGKW